MTRQVSKPALFSKAGGEAVLSGEALTELLRAVLDRDLPFRFQAKGSSMSPFIKNGDVITVAPVTRSLLHVGDVVAFTSPESDKLVVHRIIGKQTDSFLIQGDNISVADGVIPRARILGRVVKIEREGKSIVLGLVPGRRLIAFLVRRKLLIPLLSRMRKILHPIMRR